MGNVIHKIKNDSTNPLYIKYFVYYIITKINSRT